MLYEFCAENVTLLEKAMKAGARRIELCDNLAVGGTTPSYGMIEAAVALGKSYDTTIMTMIRPRGGDFIYHDLEVEIMLADIAKAKEAGSQGVVFGALTADHDLDKETMTRLIDVAEGLEITFHMAFDALARDKQLEALDWLVAHGVARILTHGGAAQQAIEEHLSYLSELVQYADGRIAIMPGGGINRTNRKKISERLGVNQLHGTRIVF